MIRYQETILEELATLGLTDEELEVVEAQEKQSRSEFIRHAEELSLMRRESATELAERLRVLLAEVGIPDATFVTELEP